MCESRSFILKIFEGLGYVSRVSLTRHSRLNRYPKALKKQSVLSSLPPVQSIFSLSFPSKALKLSSYEQLKGGWVRSYFSLVYFHLRLKQAILTNVSYLRYSGTQGAWDMAVYLPFWKNFNTLAIRQAEANKLEISYEDKFTESEHYSVLIMLTSRKLAFIVSCAV